MPDHRDADAKKPDDFLVQLALFKTAEPRIQIWILNGKTVDLHTLILRIQDYPVLTETYSFHVTSRKQKGNAAYRALRQNPRRGTGVPRLALTTQLLQD